MQTLLFESIPSLAIVAGAIAALLGIVWMYRPSRSSGRAALAAIVALPTLLAVSFGVVTPRERIIAVCNELATLADSGDADAIGRRLADDFAAVELSRDEFIQRLAARLKEFDVNEPVLAHFQVSNPSADRGVAVFDAACDVRSSEGAWGRILSRWRLTFRRQGGHWLVTGIEALPAPLSPIRDLRSVLH